jgi:hypothetical protein
MGIRLWYRVLLKKDDYTTSMVAWELLVATWGWNFKFPLNPTYFLEHIT